MHSKRRNSWPPDVSALDALKDNVAETPSRKKVVLSALFMRQRQITNIMKYELYTDASKNNR